MLFVVLLYDVWFFYGLLLCVEVGGVIWWKFGYENDRCSFIFKGFV